MMKVYIPIDFNFPVPNQETYVVHHHGISFFLLISYTVLRKIFPTCVFMTFPDFQRQLGWCQVFCKYVPEKFYIENCGRTLPRVTWYATDFLHICTLSIQSDFKCKMRLTKYEHWKLMCKESSYTITWNEEKWLITRMKFSTQKQTFLTEHTLSWGTVYRFAYLVCFTALIPFCSEIRYKWASGTQK